MKKIIIFSIIICLFGGLNAQEKNNPNVLQRDLEELLNWFPGEYDNHQQVYKEAMLNTSKERRHRQTHHIFHPVQLDFIPGLKLYAQQSQHYNLADIYRQRIYAFTVDEAEKAIRLTIYTPKEPTKFKNAHLNASIFEKLTEEDFYLKPGCEVFWKKEKDHFRGYLKENACNYYSEKFGKQVYLNETLILRKDALLLDDTAVDSEGNLVFGVADKGPTINLKEKPCDKIPELTATEIMQKAHEKAGGEFWRRPKSLTLKGHAIFYVNGEPVKNEIHNMWRVFESEKADAHVANGKVRIESFRAGQPIFIVTYDGENTYDLRGKQEKSAADNRWASNFGYGVIRHALDDGYQLEIAEEDTVKNELVYTIKVIDQKGGETFFGIDKKEFKIVKVAFQTPRGWHERIYSKFFSKPEYNWLQSGKVELFYGGKIANEVIWEDFEVNERLANSLFILKNKQK